jgi:hypothetical protein
MLIILQTRKMCDPGVLIKMPWLKRKIVYGHFIFRSGNLKIFLQNQKLNNSLMIENFFKC